MKKQKILVRILAAAVITSAFCVGVSAEIVQKGAVLSKNLPDGTLIYKEDFEGITATDSEKALFQLGWEKAEGLRKFTMKLSVANGKLYVDNLDAASEDSYALMMDSDYLKNVCNSDYTYQYDVTYIDAGNNTRYVSLLCNYDGKNNYNTVDMRIRGDGYNQVRKIDSWIHYNDTVCPLRATDGTAIITKLFGDKFDTNGFHLKGKTVTVRVETSIEKGPVVYVNGVLASDMQANKDKWNTIDSYAICFKASKLVKAEIDNIMIWTGTTDKPLEVKKEVVAPATTTTSAKTGDTAVVISASALTVSAIAFTVVLKKRKNSI